MWKARDAIASFETSLMDLGIMTKKKIANVYSKVNKEIEAAIEFAEQARLINPDINILFSTGYAENAVVEQGQLMAGVNLLKKPYRRDELLSIVQAAIQTP